MKDASSLSANEQASVLERIIERDAYEDEQWKPIFDEAKIDQRYVSGDPWRPEDREQRQKAGRPCLTLDELGQYFNQVINDVRANPLGVAFTAAGNGANEDSARLYEGMAREIEYRSNAQIAYTTAFSSMIQQSLGWVRLYPDYEHPRDVHQELFIGQVPNPLMVRCDSAAQMPDSSDMRYLLFSEEWRIAEFKRKFKGAKIVDFGPNAQRQAPNWVQSNTIKLCEYWELDPYNRTLVILTHPQQADAEGVWQDDAAQLQQMIAQGWTVAREETREDTKCMMHLTNGLEILESRPWKGRYIPFASCFGKILYVDEGGGAKRKILSMTRLARDAYMAFCFYCTSESEVVGMFTKNPYWAYEGQLSNEQMLAIQKSLHEPVAVLLAKPTIPEMPNQILPLPQRNIFDANIGSLSVLREEMRRSIQAAMGFTPLPTDAQRQNQKSGIALEKIKQSGQQGSFHFKDSYKLMIQRVGVLEEDLITPVYDTARTVRVRDAMDNSTTQRINDPRDPKSVRTDGYHLVTVSAGPAYADQREAASEFADMLAQNEKLFMLLGPLVVKMKNLGPIGDQIVELLEAVQPPEIRALSKAKQMDPQQLAQMLTQAQAQNQQMKAMLQEAAQALQAKIPELQAKIREAEIKAESAKEVAQIRGQAQLGAATIAAQSDEAVEVMRQQMQAIQAVVDGLRADVDADRESRLSREAMAHERGLQAVEHEHAERAAERMAESEPEAAV